MNTSLNVGSPIVQTPAQALGALSRAKGMDGLIMVGADGRAFAVWKHYKEYQSKLPGLIREFYSDNNGAGMSTAAKEVRASV